MDLGLKNYMEDIVAHKLDLLSNEIEICDCGRCRMDIMAYVLNKLPPKYVESCPFCNPNLILTSFPS